MTCVIGWDLGGANLKLARIEGACAVHVAQVPCPIRPDRSKFDAALGEALKLCPPGAGHAVTMTGELSDVFADRAEGVSYLVAMMRKATGKGTLFYAGDEGLLDAERAMARTRAVASANWHASAALVALHCPDGLFVDAGTTTTDIVPLRAGAPEARGHTDAERLAEGELIYAGVVRTPVMAIAQTAPFKGRTQRIAAERFATTADVWRLTGDLPEDADPYPAADLRGKSVPESAARLARMLGRDGSEAELADWVALARYFADCQLADLETTARTLMGRERLEADAPVIGAGCGRFIAQRLAQRLGRPYRDFGDLIDCEPGAREMAARSAPAVAVALLSERRLPLSPKNRKAG
jgi:(4-(4-[2-(gamma-L-glutamylamino)ethyl]phenoxymethyl)furan-2-yl)methanamine synthase